MKFPDDLELIVGANDDDTEIYFVVRSTSGRKIEQTEFIIEVEEWLAEVAESVAEFQASGASLH